MPNLNTAIKAISLMLATKMADKSTDYLVKQLSEAADKFIKSRLNMAKPKSTKSQKWKLSVGEDELIATSYNIECVPKCYWCGMASNELKAAEVQLFSNDDMIGSHPVTICNDCAKHIKKNGTPCPI